MKKSFFTKNFFYSIIKKDPYNHGHGMIIHLSCLIELGKKTELYYCSHKLMEENPNLAISWYAVGCYYYSIQNYDIARTYFDKSTILDPSFGYGWLAFGHSFAAKGEHDQAMTAYRTASRMFSG